MKKASGSLAIKEAELKFIQSSRNVRENLGKVKTALKIGADRSSTLLKVVGVTGLICFWLGRRTAPQPGNKGEGLRGKVVTSMLGLLSAFILRYGIMRLAVVFR